MVMGMVIWWRNGNGNGDCIAFYFLGNITPPFSGLADSVISRDFLFYNYISYFLCHITSPFSGLADSVISRDFLFYNYISYFWVMLRHHFSGLADSVIS